MHVPRWLWLPTLLQTALAATLCFVPLFDVLSYEFCLAVGLLAALTAPAVALGAARSQPTLFTALRHAAAGTLGHLLPALVLISANAARVRNCNYPTGLLFFLLLPGFSALYGGALGLLVGRLTRRRPILAALVPLGLALVTPLALSLWKLYDAPPIFVYDHLWGYFAGSLYDENIAIDRRLVAFRSVTAMRCLALLAMGAAVDLGTGVRRRQRIFWAMLALAVAINFDVQMNAWVNYQGTRSFIERALPIVVYRPNLVIHLPPNTDAQQQTAIANDHQFRLEELQQTLAVNLTRPIHSYMYANAEQKAALMGGRGTNVAKPWLGEIHVHNATAPHTVMPHELAHAVAASFGSKLLGLSARYELLVNMGLVEGFAQAFTPDYDDLDLHHWARALEDLHLSPNMADILGPGGFWAQAPRRAYTIAGSFVRYLWQQYGASPLKAAYPGGDFQSAYGKPLKNLVDEWQAFLRTVEVSPREHHIATERFRSASIFARPCAHEIAELTQEADQAAPAAAVLLRQRICEHLGNSPSAQLELAQALRKAANDEAFLSLSDALLGSKVLNAVQQAELLGTQSDVLWQHGRTAAAKAAARQVLSLEINLAAERLAWVRLWAMDRPEAVGSPILRYLAGRQNPLVAALVLYKTGATNPSDKTYSYLLGRQLMNVEDYNGATIALNAAAKHPFPAIEAERNRLLGECLAKTNEVNLAIAAFTAYQKLALTSGEVSQASDSLTRLRWLQKHRPGST